jgi:sulfur carrier protein ThiS
VRVYVTLKGTLADRLPGGTGEVELADDATVQAVSDQLGLPGRHCMFVVNGMTVKPNAALREGDRLQAFPPMAGG